MTGEMVEFGSVLQRFRIAAGLSQEELAERAGLSRRGISDLERGARRRPHPATVRRLAEALALDAGGLATLLAAARGTSAASTSRPTASDTPPPQSLTLRARLTSFVGREQAVADVSTLLEKARLLTLVGPGGIGKTRLALEVVRRLAEQGQSVALVELEPVRDPTMVPQTVATSLGIREQYQRGIVDTLMDVLAARRVLLVLDNCEQVVSACATLAEQLLRACPDLRILATSREVLAVDGESVWRVPPLEIADPGHLPPPHELARCACVRLFLDRASAIDSSFTLTKENASAVAEICQQLDGIPLAIELAAVRVNVLNPDQIAHRLDDRLRLLTSTSRSVPERQRTLRATLEWSYDLLTDDERRLFERLAAFAGGWTLEACEVVCSGGSLGRDDVLDLLGRLIDKSLVVIGSEGTSRRYRLLETVREYAQECLDRKGEGIAVRSAHAAAFVALMEHAAPQLASAHQLQWLHRLDVDYDNIRVAVQWSLERGDIGSALRMAPALAIFGWIRERVAAAEPANVTVPSSHPVLDLANPSAGEVVQSGDYVISGMAFDPAATDGSGISRVDLFLGSREDGGLFLGEAVPGAAGMADAASGRLAQDGFQIKVTMPTHVSGARDLYVYTTAASGLESVTSVPIYVGAMPAPTPRPSTSSSDDGSAPSQTQAIATD